MKKIRTGILLGCVAGVVDVIPMIAQNLTWDANISAFIMWIVVGFFIAAVEIKMNPVLKGILLSFLVLSPTAVLIVWAEPVSLLPIAGMTLILGGLLGFTIHRLSVAK